MNCLNNNDSIKTQGKCVVSSLHKALSKSDKTQLGTDFPLHYFRRRAKSTSLSRYGREHIVISHVKNANNTRSAFSEWT